MVAASLMPRRWAEIGCEEKFEALLDCVLDLPGEYWFDVAE